MAAGCIESEGTRRWRVCEPDGSAAVGGAKRMSGAGYQQDLAGLHRGVVRRGAAPRQRS